MTADRGEERSGTSQAAGRSPGPASPSGGPRRKKGRGLLTQYKPEQGKWTRTGTMVGFGALIAWGTYFVWEQLRVYEGDESWTLLITPGIPILFAVVFGGLLWWGSFANRAAGDFMIATEGEMKKVNWSTRREVIGSTKVVILFTALIAFYLFGVDLVFQYVFSWIGVLKR